MTITKDATKGWARPANAAEWTELLAGTGIANPDHSWDCTVGSGNLTDQIGSLTLTAVNTPIYAQGATGWAGTGVGGTEGVGTRFRANAGVGPNPTTTSQIWLVTFNLASVLATNRAFFGINMANSISNYRVLLLSTGLVRADHAGNNISGAVTHPAGDYVMVLRYDRAASVAKVYTDLETITNTYNATGPTDTEKGIGSAAYPGAVTFFQVACWEGANAETLDDTKIATIRSRIESPPSGSGITYADAVYPSNVERSFGPERSARRESFFGAMIADPVITPTFAAAVYPPNVRRMLGSSRSALRPSTFAPTTLVAPLPTFFDGVFPSNVERRFTAERSARMESFFWSYNPSPVISAIFAEAVYPPNVRRRLAPARSATRPSFAGPVDRPFEPVQALGAVPFVQPQRPMRIPRRAHLRPSAFYPSRLIADGVVTPVGSAGSATVAISIEAGATLTYRWVTDVRPFWSGLEQRASLHDRPQERYAYSTIVDDDIGRELRTILAAHTADASVLLLGLAHEGVTIGSATTTAITANLATADWAAIGLRFVALNTATGRYIAGHFTSASSGTAIGVSVDVTAIAPNMLMPAIGVHAAVDLNIGRYRVNADRFEIVADAERRNPAPTIGLGANPLTTFEGRPVWELGISAPGSSTTAQASMSGKHINDLGGLVGASANWSHPAWGRGVRFSSDNAALKQSLKLFLHTTKGRAVSFLLATGRPDLVPVGDASSGLLTVEAPPTTGRHNYVADWFPSLAHRKVKLVRGDNTFDYRSVSAAIDNGNGTQTLTLSAAFTGAIARVEFLETVRWKSDEQRIRIESNQRYTFEDSAQVVQR